MTQYRNTKTLSNPRRNYHGDWQAESPELPTTPCPRFLVRKSNQGLALGCRKEQTNPKWSPIGGKQMDPRRSPNEGSKWSPYGHQTERRFTPNGHQMEESKWTQMVIKWQRARGLQMVTNWGKQTDPKWPPMEWSANGEEHLITKCGELDSVSIP